jgi:rRNA maturation endonuclease Nob1
MDNSIQRLETFEDIKMYARMCHRCLEMFEGTKFSKICPLCSHQNWEKRTKKKVCCF